jgi:hypothetical protein
MRLVRFFCVGAAAVALVVAVSLLVVSVLERGTAASLQPGRALVRGTVVSADRCSYSCCDTDGDHCHTCYENC